MECVWENVSTLKSRRHLPLAKHHIDDTVAAKSRVDRCSRFQHSLCHLSVLSVLPWGEILRNLLTWDCSCVSVIVTWPLLMPSHIMEQCGDTLDNGSPTSNLHYVPMTTESITQLALPSTHIYSCRVWRWERVCQLKWASFTIPSNSSPCMESLLPCCTLIHSVHLVQVQWTRIRYNLSDSSPWVMCRHE